MRVVKLITRLVKYLYPPSNPFPGKYFLLPLLLIGCLVMFIFAYKTSFIEERIEFLSYSPTQTMPGKLHSLAYFSASAGDVTLGRYFYDLSLIYGVEELESDNQLIELIYPERGLVQESVQIENWLTHFPTSRDLQILRAQTAKNLGNDSKYNESMQELIIIDPNNPLVLGLEEFLEE